MLVERKRTLMVLMMSALVFASSVAPGRAQSVGGIGNIISEIKLGGLYHDAPGLWSHFQREGSGVDANIEVLFAPSIALLGGTVRPALGTTLNLRGDTSKAYGDLRWQLESSAGVFFALGIGAAIHNGNLAPTDADRKALGSRVLFHPSVELGYRFDGHNSLSLFFDHMSNGFTADFNEGMDTVGVRYGYQF